MEKRIWSKPEMNEFAFAANEYVAACANGKSYKFECDAKRGPLYWFGTMVDSVFEALRVESEKQPDFSDYDNDKIGSSYHPCEEEHEAEATSDFFWGFVDYNRNNRYDASENKEKDETVIIWRNWETDLWGNPFYNAHATKNLDINTWEIAKS